MISIDQAINAVKLNSNEVTKEVRLPLFESLNSTLFEDVYSPINMPPFRQSAMDGYALHLHADDNGSKICGRYLEFIKECYPYHWNLFFDYSFVFFWCFYSCFLLFLSSEKILINN